MNRKQRRASATVAQAPTQVNTHANQQAMQWIWQGLDFHRNGKAQDAEHCYRQALSLHPSHVDGLHLLGMACYQQGRAKQGSGYLKQCLERAPQFAEAWQNLGNVLTVLEEYAEAEKAYRKAISLKPDFAYAYNNLGNLFKMQNRLSEAVEHYKQCLTIDPDHASGCCNFGDALCMLGEFDLAHAMLEKALRLDPQLVEAHNNLGVLHLARNQFAEAKTALQNAIQLNPNYALAYSNLGNVYKGQNKIRLAEAEYRKALQLDPNMPAALINLASVLKHTGELTEAADCYERILQMQFKPAVAFQQLMLFPDIPSSVAEIDTFRHGLEDKLAGLTQKSANTITDPYKELSATVFHLGYHGKNDRPIMEETHRFFSTACPDLVWIAPHIQHYTQQSVANRKIKIGIISANFYQHTIGKLMNGIIANLPRDRFEVIMLKVPRLQNENWDALPPIADKLVTLPRHLWQARQCLAELELDVAFYADIGMDPLTYLLAYSRIAPVQCVTWGHPVTTGLPMMDYYLSSQAIEPEEAKDHYSEQLIKLKELPLYYYRAEADSQRKARSDFDLPESTTIYLLPQSLFKLHPESDALFGNLLRKDTRGELVLIEGLYPEWSEMLQQRFERGFPDVADRVRFVQRVEEKDFLALLQCADVILDPPFFGGGNTSFEAFSLNLPIVTWPGEFMRGRVTAGCYQKMGIDALVVNSEEAYIDAAYRLAHDKEWKEQIIQHISRNSHTLFENKNGIKELAAFFDAAVTAALRNERITQWPL